MNQERRNRGIDAAAETQDDVVVADGVANLTNGVADKRLHAPCALAVADPEQKVAQHGRALQSMFDFGMKLQTEKAAPGVGCRRDGRVGGSRRRHETGGQSGDRIPVAHPNLGVLRNILKQISAVQLFEFGKTIFPFLGLLHFAPQRIHHKLHAVTDAQNGNIQAEYALVHAWAVAFINARRSPGQDDSLRRQLLNLFHGEGRRLDDTINPALAHATGNQLIELRPEINDENHGGPLSDLLMKQSS